MKRLLIIISSLALLAYTAICIHAVAENRHKLQLNEIKLHSTTKDLADLKVRYQKLDADLQAEMSNNHSDAAKIQQIEDEKVKLQAEQAELQRQLQAKVEAKQAEQARLAKAANILTATATVSAEATTSDKAWIYGHESGNVPCKINGGEVNCDYQGERACGIGQALPCSKLRASCSLSDYACQDTFFTNYMLSRYGTWAQAKAFWEVNRWW